MTAALLLVLAANGAALAVLAAGAALRAWDRHR